MTDPSKVQDDFLSSSPSNGQDHVHDSGNDGVALIHLLDDSQQGSIVTTRVVPSSVLQDDDDNDNDVANKAKEKESKRLGQILVPGSTTSSSSTDMPSDGTSRQQQSRSSTQNQFDERNLNNNLPSRRRPTNHRLGRIVVRMNQDNTNTFTTTGNPQQQDTANSQTTRKNLGQVTTVDINSDRNGTTTGNEPPRKLGQISVMNHHHHHHPSSHNDAAELDSNPEGAADATMPTNATPPAPRPAPPQPGAIFIAGPGITSAQDDTTVMVGTTNSDSVSNTTNNDDNLHQMEELENGNHRSEDDEANGDLVNARPVTGSSMFDLGTATPVRPSMVQPPDQVNNDNEKKARKTVLAALGFLVLIIIIVVVIVVVVVSKDSDNNGRNQSTTNGSFDRNGTNVDVTDTGFVLDLPMQLPPDTLFLLEKDAQAGVITKPQSQAYQWIRQDPFLDEYVNNERRLLQRFAAVTFYYATGGPNWTNQGGGVMTIEVDSVDSVQRHTFGQRQRRKLSTTNTLDLRNETETASDVGNNDGKQTESIDSGSSGSNGRPSNISVNYADVMTLKEVNITSDPWLSFGTHECNWFNTATKSSKPFCDENGYFLNFDMSENGLTGTIPNEIHLFSNLNSIRLYRSELQGSLPTHLSLLQNLTKLNVGRTQISGPIPSEIGLLSNSLQDISFIGNALSSYIPSELWQLSLLQDFGIDRNKLQGSLPLDIGYLVPHLRMLRLNENQLTGIMLPSSLGLCTNLLIIDVGKNQMSGTIPSELSSLVNMTKLKIGNNVLLSGTVPSELGLLPAMEDLQFENTAVSGTLPEDLIQLSDTLWRLKLSDNITGVLPDWICYLKTLEVTCSDNLCGCNCTCS